MNGVKGGYTYLKLKLYISQAIALNDYSKAIGIEQEQNRNRIEQSFGLMVELNRIEQSRVEFWFGLHS